MKKHIKFIITHPLISGSTVIVLGGQISNFMNFLFNFFMIRNLTISDYGTLASMMSLMLLSGIPAGTVVPTVVNFAASSFAKEEYHIIRGLFFYLTKVFFVLGLLFLLLFFIFSTQISQFFRIQNQPMIIFLSGLCIFITYLGVINGAFLQAKLAFTFMTVNNFISALIKFLVGVLLVLIGFKVQGAVFAVFLSFFIPYLISFYPLRILLAKTKIQYNLKLRELFSYGAPAAITIFGLSSFIYTDILLAKHFFSADQAGIYAGISLVGKIIYFLSAPIGTVMFPLIVQKHAKGEDYNSIFRFAMILVFLPSFILSISYFVAPEFFITFFAKPEYLVEAKLLGIFGMFTSVYSVLSVITYYFLSIKRTEVFIPILIGALLQLTLIWFIHDTYFQLAIISLAVTGLLLIVLLLYYWKLSRKTTKL